METTEVDRQYAALARELAAELYGEKRRSGDNLHPLRQPVMSMLELYEREQRSDELARGEYRSYLADLIVSGKKPWLLMPDAQVNLAPGGAWVYCALWISEDALRQRAADKTTAEDDTCPSS